MHIKLLSLLFFLFALSGFSGLIYESIWTHYLKLFLGHAAYAQTLVLSIFMGGMALGSWVCSNYSTRWKKLLIGYAIAEGIIGLLALFFHAMFDNIIQFSYDTVIPTLSTPVLINVFKWTLAALFILPQSILLGMTFPLMSAGIIRMFPQKPGRTIAMLYFTNSIGAAIGVLISGFLLIRLVGLPGTMRIAGVINIALAIAVWLLIRDKETGCPGFTAEKNRTRQYSINGFYPLFLIASFITGTASFIYEIGWIRMLSLVLGSSTHAFELMLSAFILGLAFGGLWIKNRIDSIASPTRYLVYVQIIMGLLALSTLPLYENTFTVMQWLMKILGRTDTGYAIFNLSSHAIALAIMMPTTFFAGMTLPLITYSLIKQGHGEKSIGAVYAANTVGAIIGVFFAIHIGMPFWGLKGLLIFGASLDIGLGLVLLWSIAEKYSSNRLPSAVTALCIFVIAVTLLLVKLDPYKMASGVYRTGNLLTPENQKLVYHKDGKTATVSVSLENNGKMSIRTNGKTDAAINMNPYSEGTADEVAMSLLALIPMSIHPKAETVANIGLGSGLTTHILLTNPMLKQVDTVEIEKEMIEAAKSFGYRVDLFYKDPRSKIYIDDAKTFFSAHNKKYDIIISEPSNPWVSGVAGLFSEEFYRLIKRHLSENGVFVQWVQLYEIDLNLVASVFKAISSNFSDFVVYAPNYGDILIVAKNKSSIGAPSPHLFYIPETARAMERVHIKNIQDIEIRRIGNKKILNKLMDAFPIRANSDYYPVLDQNAARTRFLNASAQELLLISTEPLPAVEMLTGTVQSTEDTNITPTDFFPKTESVYMAMALRDYYVQGRVNPKYKNMTEDVKKQAIEVMGIFKKCSPMAGEEERVVSMFNIFKRMVPYLSPKEMDAIWKSLYSGPCEDSFTVTEKQWLSLFKAIGKRDAKTMADSARTLLESGKIMTQARLRYLVASGMLGFLAQGEKKESLRLWYKYQPVIFSDKQPGMLFRLLVANSTIH